jgi:hypothetical protein
MGQIFDCSYARGPVIRKRGCGVIGIQGSWYIRYYSKFVKKLKMKLVAASAILFWVGMMIRVLAPFD